MKFLISFLLILTITLQTKASYMDNLVFEDSQQKPNDSTGLKNCDEHVCSRIYRPLCISVDGIQTTLASRCHLAKLRCEAMKYNLKNTKAPRSIIRVVHTGGCYEKPKRRPNSKWLRIPEDEIIPPPGACYLGEVSTLVLLQSRGKGGVSNTSVRPGVKNWYSLLPGLVLE
ncbi:hypothetical protein CVS40_12880 [Lucilia cuprina]|nr:hypothetical protein CVS40_12880 [Lucilia cuprina]